jgi:hypothetical protein
MGCFSKDAFGVSNEGTNYSCWWQNLYEGVDKILVVNLSGPN